MMRLKATADFVQNIHSTEQSAHEPQKLLEPRLKQVEIKTRQAQKRQQQNTLRQLEKKTEKYH